MNPFSYLVVLTPELGLLGIGLVCLVLACGPLRTSLTALYGVLWAHFAWVAYSMWHLLFVCPQVVAQLGGLGLLRAEPAHDLARVGLMAVALILNWMTKRSVDMGGRVGLEFFGLVAAATSALMVLIQSHNLALTFVCLEAASLLGVAIIAWGGAGRTVGALRYLFAAGLSAGLMLWGIALVYAATGSLDYTKIAHMLVSTEKVWGGVGVALVTAGLAFKLGLFPFCYYLPGVYQRAGWTAIGFLATISKVACVLALIELLRGPFEGLWAITGPTLTVVAIATLVWGALSALHQKDLKRLLALSGVVHAGFLLAGIVFGLVSISAMQSVYFYLLAYVAAMLLLIYCLSELDTRDSLIESLHNTYARHPGFAILMTLALASMAGLPPLAGFLAKFLFFFSGIGQHQWALASVMAATSVVALYYYCNVIFAIMGRSSDLPESIQLPALHVLPMSTRVITGVLLAAVLALGLVQGVMSLLWF